MRDITLGETVDWKFTTTEPDTGAPATLSGTPVISAYVGNSTTQITAGITLSVDFDGVTGLNNVRVVASSGNGYTDNTDVALIITTGTVDSVSAVGYKVAEFTIGRAAAYTRLGAPAGASVSADIAVIESQTDDIGVAGAGLTALATQASVDTIDNFLDTEIAAILADTNELQTDWANGGRLDLILDARASQTSVDAIEAQTDDIGVAGAGLTAIPWNAAWDAEVQSEVADALAVYDPPTNAELEARTLAAAEYATAANLATVDQNVDDLEIGIIRGAAATGTLSTTQATSDLTGYADDQLIGRVIIFTSGPAEGEATDITDFAETNGLITFTALTTAPENGNSFKIV